MQVQQTVREHELLRRSFTIWLQASGKSLGTIRRYDLSVRLWEDYARKANFPFPPTREHVTEFLAHRRETQAPNTARNDHVGLSVWFKWLREEGEIKENPLEHVSAPPVNMATPDPYTADEVQAMLRACQGRSFDALRNTAIISVLTDTGLRSSEFCALQVDDVELRAESIVVRGKGGKERRVRIGSRAQLAVDRFLRARRGRSTSPYLWVSRIGQPLTPNGVFQIIRRVCHLANIANPGVHRFRHTAATFMAEADADDSDLMLLFGWSTHSMAMRYTAYKAQERALRAHRRFSPMDNLDSKAK